MDKCRESPPTDWPAAAYVLLGREDLALSCLAHSHKYKELETQTNVKLISMSTPYMLHLHPVTVPPTSSDMIGLDSTKFEDTDSVDGSMTDGMEHIFNSSTQLRYGRDLRLNEVWFRSLTRIGLILLEQIVYYYILIAAVLKLESGWKIHLLLLLLLPPLPSTHTSTYKEKGRNKKPPYCVAPLSAKQQI